jgi:hypothetical protein
MSFVITGHTAAGQGYLAVRASRATEDIKRVEGNTLLFANELTEESLETLWRVRAGIVADPFLATGAFKDRVFAECTPDAPFVYESTFAGVEGSAGTDPRANVIEALAADPLRKPTLVILCTETVEDGLSNMRMLRDADKGRRNIVETPEAFEARIRTCRVARTCN